MSTADTATIRFGAVAFLIAIFGTLVNAHPLTAHAASNTPNLTPICGATAVNAPYSDVTAADVHKPHIDCALSLDLVTAQSDTHFGSASTITRGEAALAIIALINYTPMTLAQTPTLSNGATRHPQDDALATLAQNNISSGSSLQDAQAAITRGEFADMLFTTQQRLGIPFPTAQAAQFDDINRTDVNTLAVASIAVGRTPNAFAPTLSLRRGQAATLITRAALHLAREDLWQNPTQTGAPTPAPAPAPPAPPTLELAYATTTFSRGQTNETLTPTVSNGTAASFSFTGDLPDGVTFDPNTGELTGPGSWALAGIDSMSAGSEHTCALLTDQTVWCWGDNTRRQLGDGTATASTTPVQVRAPNGAVGHLTGVTQISSGGAFVCALLQTSEVVCWGWHKFGQLGHGLAVSSSTYAATPVYVLATGSDQADLATRLTEIVAVEAGSAHACVRTSVDTVQCWGNNANGQLGDDTTTNRVNPVSPAVQLADVARVAAGFSHSCALIAQNGEVRCWGDNTRRQLGDGTTQNRSLPVAVLASGTAGNGPVHFEGATSISAHHEHTCVVMDDATARCWGYGISGQLGDGFKTNQHRPVTVMASGTTDDLNSVSLTGIVEIHAGTLFTCARLTDSTVRCWGRNLDGKLGDGTTTGTGGTNDRPNPVAVLTSGSDQTVTGSFLSSSTGITVGTDHACAYNGQSARCWGRGSNGRLGNGTTVPQANPNPVNVGLGNPGWPTTITITVTDTDNNTATATVTLISAP